MDNVFYNLKQVNQDQKTSRKVLIVDDELDICFLLGSMLKKKDYEITVVNTLNEGLKVLETQHPALIFLDNHLPDGKGINNIDKFKEMSPDSKIIMISANDTQVDRNVAYRNGADNFIGKPFNGSIVFEAIDNVSE